MAEDDDGEPPPHTPSADLYLLNHGEPPIPTSLLAFPTTPLHPRQT